MARKMEDVIINKKFTGGLIVKSIIAKLGKYYYSY